MPTSRTGTGFRTGRSALISIANKSIDRSNTALEQQERNIVCPRLFISHQKTDEPYALAIAHLAQQHGFYFWLDILDPALAIAGGGQSDPLAIAIIIEMALLNCSHVIAVMTPNTKDSTWVPYEYGRVKKLTPVTSQASAWVFPGMMPLPEYLYLGPRHRTEGEIAAWLDDEMRRWPSGGDCARKRDRIWRAMPDVPTRLPG